MVASSVSGAFGLTPKWTAGNQSPTNLWIINESCANFHTGELCSSCVQGTHVPLEVGSAQYVQSKDKTLPSSLPSSYWRLDTCPSRHRHTQGYSNCSGDVRLYAIHTIALRIISSFAQVNAFSRIFLQFSRTCSIVS